MSIYTRRLFLDTSALLKWILYPEIEEVGAKRIADYLSEPVHFAHSNLPCVTEALCKLKWMVYHKHVDIQDYKYKVYWTKSMIETGHLTVSDFNYWDRRYSDRALELVDNSNLKIDFLDAIQIVDVLDGPSKIFAGPSETVLTTADKNLRDIARQQNIMVWYPAEEEQPPIRSS